MVVVVVVEVLVDVDVDVLVDAVEEVGAIEVVVVARWSSGAVAAHRAAAASADSPSEPPHPARTIDASAVVDCQHGRGGPSPRSPALVAVHRHRSGHPTPPMLRISRTSAIRSAWRTQAGIPIPR